MNINLGYYDNMIYMQKNLHKIINLLLFKTILSLENCFEGRGFRVMGGSRKKRIQCPRLMCNWFREKFSQANKSRFTVYSARVHKVTFLFVHAVCNSACTRAQPYLYISVPNSLAHHSLHNMHVVVFMERIL